MEQWVFCKLLVGVYISKIILQKNLEDSNSKKGFQGDTVLRNIYLPMKESGV